MILETRLGEAGKEDAVYRSVADCAQIVLSSLERKSPLRLCR
jgi:hypothetical protein